MIFIVNQKEFIDIERSADVIGKVGGKNSRKRHSADTPFSDLCAEAVGGADICGSETDGLDCFLPGDENGPLVLELLTDDDELGLTGNLFGPDHGIQGPESGIVQEEDLFRPHGVLPS